MKPYLPVNTPRSTVKSDYSATRQSDKNAAGKSEFGGILSSNIDAPAARSEPSLATGFEHTEKAKAEFSSVIGTADLSGKFGKSSSKSTPTNVMELHDILVVNPEVSEAAGWADLPGRHDDLSPNSALSVIDQLHESLNVDAQPLDKLGQKDPNVAQDAILPDISRARECELPDSKALCLPSDSRSRPNANLVSAPIAQVFSFKEGMPGLQNILPAQDDKPSDGRGDAQAKGGNLPTVTSRSPERRTQAHAQNGFDKAEAARQHFDVKSDSRDRQNVFSKVDERESAKAQVPANLLPTDGDFSISNLPPFAHFANPINSGAAIESVPVSTGIFATQLERHVFISKANSLHVQLDSSLYGTVSARFSGNGDQMSVVVSSSGSAVSESLSELESELRRWVEVFEPDIKSDPPQFGPRHQEMLDPGRDIRQGALPTYDFTRPRQDQQHRQHGRQQQDSGHRHNSEVEADQIDERWITI